MHLNHQNLPLSICLGLKSDLRGQRYEDVQELKMAVRSAIFKNEKDWFGDVYKQMVERHRKCLQEGGGYFEKL